MQRVYSHCSDFPNGCVGRKLPWQGKYASAMLVLAEKDGIALRVLSRL